MDIYLPISDAANRTGISIDRLHDLIRAGRIKAAMMTTGVELVSEQDILQPLCREDTAEYRSVSHLRGTAIGMRQAMKKYKLSIAFLSRWTTKGLIRRLSGETMRGQRVMVDEADVAYCSLVYHANPGQGKRIFNPDDGLPYKKESG